VAGDRRVRGEDRRELPLYLVAPLDLREHCFHGHRATLADGENIGGPELGVARLARKQLGERVDDQLGQLEHAREPADGPRGDEPGVARVILAGGAGRTRGTAGFPLR
jgi:hypothetical protein